MTTATSTAPAQAGPPRPSRPRQARRPPAHVAPVRGDAHLPSRPEMVELLLTLLAVAVALATSSRLFSGPGWVAPVIGALLLGVGTPVVFRWRSWSARLIAPVGAVLLVIFQLCVLYPTTTLYGLPTSRSLTALGDGLTSGWARMLSVALPADPSGDLLALPTLSAFVAGASSAVLVLRTRAVVALTAIPIVLFVAGLLVTASRPGFGMALTATLLTVLLVLLLIRTNRLSAADDGFVQATADTVGLDLAAQRRHSTAGRVLIGLPAVVVIVALAVVGGRLLPLADGTARVDPRAWVTPAVILTSSLSPLVEVKPQLVQAVPTDLYEISVRAPEGLPVDRVRIVALDTFDGALWTQAGQFRVAGSVLPETPRASIAREVTLDVRVLTSRTPYLPVIGIPERTRGVAAGVESASGTLISLAAAAGDSIDGVTYELTAAAVPPQGVERAAVGTADAGLLATPGLPVDLRLYATETTQAWATPWEKLKALEKNLYERDYSLAARPGESYGAITRVLLDEDGAGYAEQYASAFAVAARALGFPSRIAVGYRLDDATKLGDNYTVTTADADAWPEVLLDGYGWVPFTPTNVANDAGAPPPLDPEIPPLPDVPTPPTPADPDGNPDDPDVPVGSADGVMARAALVGLWIGLGVIALVATVVGGIVGATSIRRARRRSVGTPARRIAAAWQEILDRWQATGHRVARSDTPNELADAIARSTTGRGPGRALTSDLHELGVIVTTAVCAPAAPTALAAKRAWEIHDSVVPAMAGNRSLPRRILSRVDPRPLLPGRSRLTRDPGADSRDASAHSAAGVPVHAGVDPTRVPAAERPPDDTSTVDLRLTDPVVVTLPVVAARAVAREQPPAPVPAPAGASTPAATTPSRPPR